MFLALLHNAETAILYNRAVSCDIFSVYICFMVAMLVYCNIQYSIGEKLFHCHFGEMQAAIAIHCLHMITACPTYANNRR